MICQNFYWCGIRKSVQKDVNNCDTCQHKKWQNQYTYGKFTDNLYEEIPWNKLYVDLISPYRIHRKGNNKDLIIKYIMMDDNLANVNHV